MKLTLQEQIEWLEDEVRFMHKYNHEDADIGEAILSQLRAIEAAGKEMPPMPDRYGTDILGGFGQYRDGGFVYFSEYERLREYALAQKVREQ